MRQSGILMHITSLPSPYGVGTMGKEAYAFVDFLKKSGQSLWQVLPLSPTGYGDSPYQSCSTYAGNHYLIDLKMLVEDGLLTLEEVESIPWGSDPDRVDYALLYQSRLPLLRKAYSRFTKQKELDAFCSQNSSWLADFSLFMALKDRYGGKPWFEWESGLKFRNPNAIWQARQELSEDVRFYCFVQYLFDTQWNALRQYAHDHGVSIIGDVPIYVPLDSSDVWSNPELFQLDTNLNPEAVAGVPPDGFTEDGQLWGNPLYRWDIHKKDGYSWWLRRLAAAGQRYDTVRIDHFRAFEAYWSVPFGDKTARNGKWVKGPDMDFINAVKTGLPGLSCIAEDLGYLTPEVLSMRDESGWPGMKVLEFAFYGENPPSDYLPHRHVKNSVVYLGTHDNLTMRQWLEETEERVVSFAAEYMHLTKEEGYVWGAIRTAMSSVADTCIIQLQDFLELGAEARMNSPGSMHSGNWTWRVRDGLCTDALAERIYKMTNTYYRVAKATETER